MNKSISRILVAIIVLLSFTACEAQIKDAKTATVKIYGNCDMCKETIEKAGNSKKLAKVDWNTDTKMATAIYPTTENTNNSQANKKQERIGEKTNAAWENQKEGFFYNVVSALLETGFSEEEIIKIGGANYCRILTKQ